MSVAQGIAIANVIAEYVLLSSYTVRTFGGGGRSTDLLFVFLEYSYILWIVMIFCKHHICIINMEIAYL